MVLENGSGHHLTRDTRTSGSLPSPWALGPLSSVPSTHPVRRITGPRRKRSAEHAVLTQRTNAPDQPDQENKFIIHRRTSSLETIRTRSSKQKKTPQVADHDTALLNPTSAGALKQKLKSFFPSSIIVFDLRGVSNNLAHDPRRQRVEKPVNQADVVAPSSQPSPTSFDVDHPDVATGTATLTTSYLSIDALDDLFRWDMDYIPTIPSTHSPPDSPKTDPIQPSSATTTNTTISTTPFSTPINDDELLEYEIPFPLNRQTKVVLENMGVKKSRTMARTRSASGVSAVVNRQFLPPTKADSLLSENADDLTENRSLGLPNPLPPRTMCPKRDALHPLGCASASLNMQPTPSPSRKVSPVPVPNPSTSRTDSWGCTHLGAADCELSILFPQTSHFEVWDMGDNAHIACPAMLCILAKDPKKWSGKPLALPDVSLINIHCKDIPFPSPMSKFDRTEEYATLYAGPKTGTANDDLIPDKDGAAVTSGGISAKAISFDGKWARTYKMPGVEGSGRRHRTQPDMGVDTSSPATGAGSGSGTVRGWYLQFWIPIPTRLFEKRETRAFAINARVWMMGDEQRVLSLDRNEGGKVFPLLGDANMTVSHLRKERDMDGCW